MGRPTDYDSSYCERAIEFGRAGKSRAYIAAQFGVARQTLHNWEATYPEFLDAMDYARDLAQAWWEDKGQDGLTQQGFNASIWSRSMAARFQDDWREVKATEHSGPGGKPIEHKVAKATERDDDTLAAIAASKA